MGKKIAKHHRIGRSITAALLVFSLGVGLSLTLSASAVTLNLPADTAANAGGEYEVRDMQSGGSSFGGGINLGPSSPSGTPGAGTTQPVPQFSLINTPAVVNDDGPLEVPDDLRVYGLTEVMGGLINNGGGAGGGGGDGAGGGGAGGGGAPVVPTLTVAVTGDTPTCNSVEKGTSGNSVTKLSLTASGGDVKVSSLTLTRGGTATENDIESISVINAANNTVLADSIKNDPVVKTRYLVVFSPVIPVVVGTPVNLIVKVETESDASIGRTFYFGVNSNTEVIANRLGSAVGTDLITAGGTFPMRGNTCTISSAGGAPSTPPTPPAPGIILSVSGTAITTITVPLISPAVTITLSADNANADSSSIERVWTTITNLQAPSTKFNIQLTETGISTGVFTSDFMLSTLSHNAASRVMRISSCNDNSVHVQYPADTSPIEAGYTLVATPSPRLCGGGGYTTIPGSEGGPDVVEAVTLLDPDFAEKSPIALFGSFIPTAYAASGFPEPDSGAAGSDLLHPVTVFDDLYVFGNGAAEPGNAVINGFLRAGQDGLTSQISGNLNLLGALVTVSDDLEVLGNITTATLNASASVTAGSIGQFYRVTNTVEWTSGTGPKTAKASCATGDILISCTGRSTSILDTKMYGSEASGRTCQTVFNRLSSAGTDPKQLKSQAVCFNPDGSANRPSPPTLPTGAASMTSVTEDL